MLIFIWQLAQIVMYYTCLCHFDVLSFFGYQCGIADMYFDREIPDKGFIFAMFSLAMYEVTVKYLKLQWITVHCQ